MPPGLCAPPPPVHTAHLGLPSQISKECIVYVCIKYVDDTTIINHFVNNNESSDQEEINNLHKVLHREQYTAQLQQNQGADC